MKKFIYIPSFDSAVSQLAGKKNLSLKDGTPWRFWDENFPEFHQNKTFLVSAGHNYKKMNHTSEYEFPPDMFVMGDSGGYQIATGVLTWNEELRTTIFKWLENNCAVAINLDLPPRGQFAGKFHEALDFSVKNFQYFHENQTGKVKFLNVLHGSTYDKYKHWYNSVSAYEFNGWACGGSIGKLNALMDWLIVLLEGGEFDKKSVEYVHMLGASSILDFLVLAQIQKSLFERGSTTTITTDSSTPSRGTAYGLYYTGFDFKNLAFKYITIPKKADVSKFAIQRLPVVNEMDEKIFKNYTLEEYYQFKSEHYAWMVLHNYIVFLDAYRLANDYIWSDYGILEQIVNSDTLRMLRVIDKIIKSDHPRQQYLTHISIFEKMARMAVTPMVETNVDFF